MSAGAARAGRQELEVPLGRLEPRDGRRATGGGSEPELSICERRVDLLREVREFARIESELVSDERANEVERQVDKGGRLTIRERACKLAGERTIERPEEAAAAAGGGRAEGGAPPGTSDKPAEQRADELGAAVRGEARKKLGLLEALLGERGRSWFEHKPVILNIEKGPQRPCDKRAAAGEIANDTGTPRASADEQELRGERTESAGTRPKEVDEQAGKQVSKRYARLPTFGSVPQRLSINPSGQQAPRGGSEPATSSPSSQQGAGEKKALPYFAYHGRARNVEPSNGPGGRRTLGRFNCAREADRSSLASGRLGSSSSLTTSANSSSSSSSFAVAHARPSAGHQRRPSSVAGGVQQRPASQQRQQQQQGPPAGRSTSSSLGFSNISNLFPHEPVTPRRPRDSRSSSLINLVDKQSYARQQQQLGRILASPAAAVAGERARFRRQEAARVINRPAVGAGAMMRQRAGGAGNQQQQTGLQQPGNKANYQRQQQQQNQRLRPSSATGNFLGGVRQRSPGASYRLGSAGMSPLADPDCPVHGDDFVPAGRAGFERANKYPEMWHERAGYAAPGRQGAHYASLSQPDLAYGAPGAPHDDPYNLEGRVARDYPGAYGDRSYKTSPVYSPIDYEPVPTGYERANGRGAGRSERPATGGAQREREREREREQQAYYNNSSRFSLYHPAGNGSGGVRSELAPTGEQLRRILGYRPAPLAKPVHLHPQWAHTRPFIHLQPAGSGFGRSPSPSPGDPLEPDEVPKFAPFNRLKDNQAIRAVDFHPSGEVYAVGSNSRALRICAYPAEHELRHFDPFEGEETGAGRDPERDEPAPGQRAPRPPRVLFKFLQVHRGSIYCVSFNPAGQLLATGSNDQTVHIVKYNSLTHNPDGEEFRLTMHNGTVRDLCFIDDSSGNGSSLLLSAGGGDNKIYVTDCDTITPFQSMAGHTQMVMALSHCGGAQFVSGSYDRTIRFWDLRSRSCTSIVSAPPLPAAGNSPGGNTRLGLASGPGAAVCALRVDPSGRLLASGHTDTTCMLYDIRGGKIIQTFRPHDDEIRALSFSPKSYYLLTGGYDGRLVVSDLQGDLTRTLPSACVAESQDKIVQAKWHPADFTFVTTSADKSATLWSLPGEVRS